MNDRSLIIWNNNSSWRRRRAKSIIDDAAIKTNIFDHHCVARFSVCVSIHSLRADGRELKESLVAFAAAAAVDHVAVVRGVLEDVVQNRRGLHEGH